MSSKEFFLPLSLPPAGQVASGIRFLGSYHSVFAAALLPGRLKTPADVRIALAKMGLHVRLTPQEGILRLKLVSSLAAERVRPTDHGRRGPPLATWKVACEVDLLSERLSQITALQAESITYLRDGTSSKEIRSQDSHLAACRIEDLLMGLEKHFQDHFLRRMQEMFCAFAPEFVAPSTLASRLPDESSEQSVQVSYETLVPRHIPLEFLLHGERYEFIDYHELKLRSDVINVIVVRHDRQSGHEVVIGGVAFHKGTGEVEDIRMNPSVHGPSMDSMLAQLEDQHPLSFRMHLVARSRLIGAIASFHARASISQDA